MPNRLAKALFFEFYDADEQHLIAVRDALFDELQQLAETHSGSPGVREQFANALVNRLNSIADQPDLENQERLFNTLSHLATGFPGDQLLRQRLRMAIKGLMLRQQQQNSSTESAEKKAPPSSREGQV
jgi:hypothetical protein